MLPFNNSHPEKRDDETFIFNEPDQPNNESLIKFATIDYSTKRLGIVAYDDHGNILANAKPVFVSTSEIQEHLAEIPPKNP